MIYPQWFELLMSRINFHALKDVRAIEILRFDSLRLYVLKCSFFLFPFSGFGCVSLFWLARNEPELFIQERCDCAGGIMDYLVTVLCGLDQPVMSEHIAASWGYYNTETRSWNLEM